MKSQFTEQLDKLEKRVIEMGTLVETQLGETIDALTRADTDLARKVIADDKKIDEMEMQIDEDVLSLLALHQPVAFDLRDILGISKINGDLERIGDHAQNIAESALTIGKKDANLTAGNIPRMCEVAKGMLRDSIDSFIHKNVELALSVCRRDDEIDNLNKHLFADILAGMIKNPQIIPTAMEIIRISKNIERVADLCTNICEDVVFIRDAKSIKHSREQIDR